MLRSMAEAYRDAPVACPGCDARMEAYPLLGSTIDVCPECAGVWADWFDGELAAIAREAPALRSRGPSRSGTPACPRCQRPLEGEPIPGPGDYGLFRCAECVGAFVPRGSFEALIAAATPAPVAPEPIAFARLVALLRALLAPRAPDPG